MQSMAMSNLRVMRGLFVIASLVMLCGFAVVLRRVFVVVCGVLMMLMYGVVAHNRSPVGVLWSVLRRKHYNDD
jgi:hypothetical protein